MFHLSLCRFLICVAFLGLFVGNRPANAQQSSDLNRLAHPEVSDRLGLDDGQRAEIQRLLQQRTEATVIEDADEKKEKLAEIDQQIRETLSEEQWEQWQETVPTGGLKFQFREQPWADVLQWFAEQEGLTLVMDRAPPGTFTYSDTREYTSAQAIDLLNSVLLTRGYTLVRREKMLTLLQLSDSIPIELIPEVKLEELPSRGRFELVRVQFSLGARPVEAVMKEVTPYLGSFGRAIPLPQSRRLLVIEAAGKMETINVLVNSVPEPKKEQPAKPKEKPPEPVFAAYPLGEMDGEAVLETIGNLIGSQGITVDEKTRLLTAYTVPGKHKAIQSALEEMQSSLRETPAVTSVAYELTGGSAEAIQEQLSTLAPRALIAVDQESQRVLVTASPTDQEKIAAALTALGISRTSLPSAIRAFQVEAGEAASLASSLQEMLPDSQVVGNDTLGTLVVRGPEQDLELADEVIRRWSGEETLVDKVLHTFPLPHPADSDWLSTVAKLVPKAEIWLDSTGEQLVLLGSQADRQRIESTLPELVTAIPRQPERELRTYSLAPAELERWQELQENLAEQLENAQFVIQPAAAGRPAELLVWATAEEHQSIDDFIKQIKGSTPEAEMLWPRMYPLADRDAELVGQLIETSFPGIRVSVDESSQQMTVWAARATHEDIVELLAAIQAELPPKPKLELQSYSLPEMEPSDLQELIESVLPSEDNNRSVTVDANGNRLLVRASEETHQQLDALMEELREPPPTDQEKILMAYTLEHADAADVKTVLDAAVQGATVVADARRGQLIATATLQQHGQIKSIVGEIDRPGSASNAKEIRSYSLREVQASALLPTLESLWPRMELSADEESNQIIASGTAAEHQALRNALDRLGGAAADEDLRLDTYSVPLGDLPSLPAVLAQIAPQAVISTDETNRTLTVWASDAQHQRIGRALEQLSESASQRDEILLFQVPVDEISTIESLLESLFPSAKVAVNATSGQLTVLAPKTLRQQITDMVEEQLQAAESADQPEPQTYRVDRSIRSAFTALLETTAPRATLVENETGGSESMMVLALAKDHDKIQSMLERLQEQVPQAESSEVRVYELNRADPSAFASLLDERRPEARVIGGEGTDRLVIADSAAGHEIIAELVEELETAFDGSAETELRVYSLREDLAEEATGSLSTIVPKASLLPSENSQRLAVLASGEDHRRLAEWLEQLKESVPPPEATVSRVYPLQTGDPESAVLVLETLLPDATFAADVEGKSVAATATEEAQETIADFVRQYDQGLSKNAQTRVFTLGRGDARAMAGAVSQMAPGAGVSAERSSNTLIVTAPDEMMEEIARLVQEVENGNGASLQTKSYVLENSSPITLQRALAGMYPQATVAADSSSGGLLVAATAEQHEQIAGLVEDLNAAPGQTGTLTTHRLKQADADEVASALQEVFGRRSSAGVSADRDAGMVFVVGQADHQKIAADLIEQMDQTDAGRQPRQLKVFSLTGGNGSEIANAVERLFESDRPQVDVEYDLYNEQLVVIGSEEQLRRVEETLQQFEPPDRQLEIFALTANDPEPVRDAIDSLFSELPYNATPSVLIDENRGQLLVRATAEQHERIARLMRRLGESPEPIGEGAVAGSNVGGRAAPGSSRVRSIQVGQDSENLLRRLQEIWPSVRENPLQVVRPASRSESRPRPASSQNPAALRNRLDPGTPRGSDAAGGTDDSPDLEALDDSDDSRDAERQPSPTEGVGKTFPAGSPRADIVDAETTVAFRAPLPQKPVEDESERGAADDPDPSEQLDEAADAPAPVVIVPGAGHWTIASEDPRAVQALAELIESTTAAPVTAYDTGTSHSVYILRFADANELQTVLTNLFQQGSTRRSRTDPNQTTVVADARINALIVRGSRADRRTVEELLTVLDSPEFVGVFEPSPPQYVPVENTDAARVEQILRTVYRAQLSSGGGRTPVTIPAGISEDLRTMLRQINAEASGPLLTLSVDEITNAIVMRAPPELADEVRTFIEQVDQQANSGRRRGVRIIPLRESNTQGMEEALDALRAAR